MMNCPGGLVLGINSRGEHKRWIKKHWHSRPNHLIFRKKDFVLRKALKYEYTLLLSRMAQVKKLRSNWTEPALLHFNNWTNARKIMKSLRKVTQGLTNITRLHIILKFLANIFTFWDRCHSPWLVPSHLPLPHQSWDIVQLERRKTLVSAWSFVILCF